MPPIMFLALVGAAGIAGYRILSSVLGSGSRTQRSRAGEARRTARTRDLGNLEWDENAGVYRPSTKRES
ncbi:hypothetical protein [Hyphomicrobium sp.]|jgi:hypothetical protein|uniref:hypothetical protein n=1 Tax=Hyphomicrobium sp. TaxID=82 RepID=UPI002C1E0513|nr:hypothetical protein [Hyphomicrobium sp.]HVZ06141.1 hypothetical protein [Hyphomicrobium sp.]